MPKNNNNKHTCFYSTCIMGERCLRLIKTGAIVKLSRGFV